MIPCLSFISFEQMKEAGMSPLEIILVLAFIALVLWTKKVLDDHVTDRQAWHAETRSQVDESKAEVARLSAKLEKMNEHVDECERDRVKLNIQQVSMARELDTLRLLVQTYRSCSAVSCPMKGKEI